MIEPVLIFFLVFGVLLGTVFGFFAMGGSFLITPLLIILGYPTSEAVGTGLAFVFGTAIISVLKHREFGQVDYKLGATMGTAMSLGLLIGSKILAYLEELGNADIAVGAAYIILLTVVGIKMLRAGEDKDTAIKDSGKIYPMIEVGKNDKKVSLWTILLLGFITGTVAGFMGVGGGFLLVPVMTLFMNLNASIAVGTSILVVMLSSGYGTFIYSGQEMVNLKVVSVLLFGSGLGAKIGSKASNIVPENDLETYFGIMVLLGALAITVDQLNTFTEIRGLSQLSLGVIIGSTLFMSGLIYWKAISNIEK